MASSAAKKSPAAGPKEGPVNGPVTVELGGTTYELRLDLNALAFIGDRLGFSIRLRSIQEDLLDQELTLDALRVLVLAVIRHQDPSLTEEEVGAMVTQDNIMDVTEAFFSLFGVSLEDLSRLQLLGDVDVDASDQGETSR